MPIQTDPTLFASELKRWRHHRRYSQLQLANQAQVSQRHLSFLENGRSRPSPEMVEHLSIVLGVPLRARTRSSTPPGSLARREEGYASYVAASSTTVVLAYLRSCGGLQALECLRCPRSVLGPGRVSPSALRRRHLGRSRAATISLLGRGGRRLHLLVGIGWHGEQVTESRSRHRGWSRRTLLDSHRHPAGPMTLGRARHRILNWVTASAIAAS